MAAALIPTDIQIGKKARVVLTLSSALADDLVATLSNAPRSSSLRKKLEDSNENTVPLKLDRLRSSWVWEFTPDIAGVYTISVQEVSTDSVFGGGYEDDPDAAFSPVVVGSPTTVTVAVPQRMILTLDAGSGLKADLVLWVTGSSVIKTLNRTYGENTPRLIPRSTDSRVITACEDANVLSSLSNAVGSVNGSLGTLASLYETIRTTFNTHIADAAHHATNQDTDNTIDTAFASPGNERAFVKSVNELLRAIRNHAANDDGGGTWGGDYHTAGGDPRALLVQSVGDYATALVGLGDAIGFLREHFDDDTIHDTADPSTTPTTGSHLLTIARYWCDAIRKIAPTTPETINEGALQLAHGVGFREEEL